MMPIKKLFIIFVLTSLPSVWAMQEHNKPALIPYEETSEEMEELIKLASLRRWSDEASWFEMAGAKGYTGGQVGRQRIESLLAGAASQGYKPVCEFLIRRQKQVNEEIVVVLMCLKRMQKEGNNCACLLYKERKKLILPHLYPGIFYIPLTQLLAKRDCYGKRAFDYLPIDVLAVEENK
jgi:hypothetical protein